MQKSKLAVIIAAAVAAAAFSQVASAGQPVFTNGLGTVEFTQDKGYYGSFEYGGVTYGVGEQNFDVAALAEDSNVYVIGEYISPNVPRDDNGVIKKPWDKFTNSTYRVYKQKYSAVVGNTALQAVQFDEANRDFVRDVVGQATTQKQLDDLGDVTLTYKGDVFNHIKNYAYQEQDGRLVSGFAYKLDLGNQTGEGEIAGVEGKHREFGVYNVRAKLESAPIRDITTDGIKGVKGDVTFTADAVDSDPDKAAQLLDSLGDHNNKYTLGIYCPNAEEVSGAIHDAAEPSEQNIIGGLGFAGKKQ